VRGRAFLGSAAVPDGPRCAEWAREVAVDPVGTAPSARAFLLVEWPLPWPRDAGDVEPLQPLRDALAASGTRLQLVVPSPDSPTRSVVLHRPPAGDDGGWFAGFERVVRRVEPGGVVEEAAHLLAGGGDTEPGADVLLCSHGARDRCCGSMGSALTIAALAEGIAVRRTSHTGGHRFAPTAVLLPEGTAWAFLDGDALRRITTRTGPLDDLLPRYRGCGTLGPPAVQAVERVAFAEIGWSWLDHRRRAVELDDGVVRIEAIAPGGAELAWEAQVEPGRRLPVPDCGHPIEEAAKSEVEVVVRTVARVG